MVIIRKKVLCLFKRKNTFLYLHLIYLFLFLVTSVAFRPDGLQFAVASLDGSIRFWHPRTCMMVGMIDGRRDLIVGRRKSDLVSAKQLMSRRYFIFILFGYLSFLSDK